ncbi:MAG: aminoacyl-tRNA hydrolase [Patescibacteria group bacterium]
MKLIVGLGNPGEQYHRTRHNIGFRVVDFFGDTLGMKDWTPNQKFHARLCRGRIGKEELLLALPETFMNDSGIAAAALATFYHIAPQDFLVISDDKDLLFGKIRVRTQGSDGGHRGLRSILQNMGTVKIPRVKIGVLPPSREIKDTSAFVLRNFTKAEEAALAAIIPETATFLRTLMIRGVTDQTVRIKM